MVLVCHGDAGTAASVQSTLLQRRASLGRKPLGAPNRGRATHVAGLKTGICFVCSLSLARPLEC
eukprot:11578894-Heterocapsa_arctica.AAC.1